MGIATGSTPTDVPSPPRSTTSATAASDRFLRIYMSDQLALGVLWRELARRAEAGSDATAVRAALHRVATAIAEDVAVFEQIMRRLGFSTRTPKVPLAVIAERLGRLKPNGRLIRRSPLSGFVELDMLIMGIDGKVVLWQNLRDGAGLRSRLPDIDFDELIDRARCQRADLEPFHLQAARDTLRPADQH
ncbi:MAG TPA: hypothetical protein VF526_20730 [Solirubrobacteraceae bacterium]|jgi:hypothetical protein